MESLEKDKFKTFKTEKLLLLKNYEKQNKNEY